MLNKTHLSEVSKHSLNVRDVPTAPGCILLSLNSEDGKRGKGITLSGVALYALALDILEAAQYADEQFAATSAAKSSAEKSEVEILRAALEKLSTVDDSQRFNRCALAVQALLDANKLRDAGKPKTSEDPMDVTLRAKLKEIEDRSKREFLTDEDDLDT